MTLIGAALALLLLDPPWTWIVIGGLVGIDLFEISVWLKWRRKKSITGAESIVGARGRAMTDCAPEGQVKLRGQIWKARSEIPLTSGTEVVVTGIDGLRLDIAPAEATSAPLGSDPRPQGP